MTPPPPADTFGEALALIEALRDLLQTSAAAGGLGADLPPEARMVATREASRLTSRATAAMSVLLLHRAQDNGQSEGLEGAADKLPALLADLEAQTPVSGLPAGLAALTDRAEALFARIRAQHAARGG